MKLLNRRKVVSEKNNGIIKRKTEPQGLFSMFSIFSVGIVGRSV
jgi:hypothetical protein